MAVFRDEQNREWVLSISVLDVKNLRENVDPPINLTDPESLGRVFDNELLQYEVVWQLVKAQAEKLGIGEVEFAHIFTSNFINAMKAFVEALQNFFRLTGRVELSELISKILSASTRLRSVVEKNLLSEKFSQVLDKVVTDEQKRIDKEMDKFMASDQEPTPTTLSGNSLES